MNAWSDLERELDAWAAAGRVATLWWRDDDAVTVTPGLERLLTLAAQALGRTMPVALAVVPALADVALAERLCGSPGVAVLQHGYAHRNHAPSGAKKAEFGGHRPLTAMASELQAGRRRLQGLLGGPAGRMVLPVLVPPWNRIDGMLARALPDLGFFGISMYRAREGLEPHPGLRIVNTQVDVVDWRNGKVFLGTDPALLLAIDHLAARRRGGVDEHEPTGLLTHHLVHQSDAWDFIAELFRRTAAHPGARWVDAHHVFADAVGDAAAMTTA